MKPLKDSQYRAAYMLQKRSERGEEITIEDVYESVEDNPIDADVVALLLFHVMPKAVYSYDGKTVRSSPEYIDVRGHEVFCVRDYMRDALSFYQECNRVKFQPVSLDVARFIPSSILKGGA